MRLDFEAVDASRRNFMSNGLLLSPASDSTATSGNGDSNEVHACETSLGPHGKAATARGVPFRLSPHEQPRLNLFPGAPLLHLHRHKHWTFMAQPIPLSRHTGFARARHAKAMLLPIARQTADDLALRVHLALDALRRGAGSVSDAQTLTQIMLLTGFLAESGFGSATDEQLGAAERVVANVFDIGRETDKWSLNEAGFALFATIATNYDQQLHCAPLWAITDASERLDRFTAGSSYEAPMRKRA